VRYFFDCPVFSLSLSFFDQVSISPTFYKQLFHAKVFFGYCTAFLHLQFGFVIICQKNIAAKGALKMLAKLTQGVDFINILQARFFLHKSKLHSFSLNTVRLCDFLSKWLSSQKVLVKCWRNWLKDEGNCFGETVPRGFAVVTFDDDGSSIPLSLFIDSKTF